MHAWKEAVRKQHDEWVEHGKSLKEKFLNMERQRAERDALLTMKKKVSAQVKMEVLQLAQYGTQQKSLLLASNRSQAGRIRTETASGVTDGAKKFMYDQRKQAAVATHRTVKEWEAERRLAIGCQQRKHGDGAVLWAWWMSTICLQSNA